METKMHLVRLPLTAGVYMLLAVFMLAAQSTEKNYFLKQTEDGKEGFVQRLSWEPSDYSMCYEVVIGKEDEQNTAGVQDTSGSTEAYKELSRSKTTDSFIEVSLPPGTYRYAVTVYNLLGKPETTSDWLYFNISRAYQPEVHSVFPKTIYLEEPNDGKFSITGKNLREDSRYSLCRQGKNGEAFTAQLTGHDENDKKAELQFDMKKLDTGIYSLTVTNPGGLTAQDGPVTIKFKKRIDFDVSAGYTVPVVLYDNTMKTYLNTNVFPLSMTSRCSFMPFKHRFGYFGAGLDASYSRLYAKYDMYSLDGNFVTCHLNFVYQLPVIKNHLVLELHGGGGAVFFGSLEFHFEHDINTDPFNGIEPSFDAGAAVQVYILKRLYVDVCADYIHAFMPDMSLGMIVPSLSAGWQF
jgi:hypothetical protein